MHRKKLGWSVRHAAELAGISDSYWGGIERGFQKVRSKAPGVFKVIQPQRPMLIQMLAVMRLSDRDANVVLKAAGYAPVVSLHAPLERRDEFDLTGISRRDLGLLNALADRLREEPQAPGLRSVARKRPPGAPRG